MNVQQLQRMMKEVDLFQGLTRDEVAAVFAKGMTMKVLKGDVVFRKDTVGSQMYVVLGGKVGIVDGGKILASLGTGDMFGEMALVTNEPRSATVGALEDSMLFVLTESVFERLLTKRVAVRMLLNIVRTLSRRLKDANLRLVG